MTNVIALFAGGVLQAFDNYILQGILNVTYPTVQEIAIEAFSQAQSISPAGAQQ